MKMNEIISMLPSLIAGGILGIIFFGGLWLTIQKALHSKKAALLFVSSFVTRIAIILTGFYYVCQHSWQKMLICLAGFLIARTIITRVTQKNNHSKITLIKEVSNEA
jgi:F1F0 ATPase subunit 2